MNSREGTKLEKFYGDLCTDLVGCMACLIDGKESQNPNGSWIGFHHNEHVGSRKPGCHFWACGLCAAHHQGINTVGNKPFRHGDKSGEFKIRYGSEYELALTNWVVLIILKKEVETRCKQAGIDYLEFMNESPFLGEGMWQEFVDLRFGNQLFNRSVKRFMKRYGL